MEHNQGLIQSYRQRGSTLVIIGFGLALLMGAAGLAIDLAALYVVRSEAQRAADAAALAGARAIVDSGYPSGLVSQGTAALLAAQQAASVGNQNLVGGINPGINAAGFANGCPPAAGADGCFDFSNPQDPRITVVVQRTVARGNAVPTFFMRIFGVQQVNVSASATAEAYLGAAGGPGIASTCLKPWLMPNCDPDPSHAVAPGDPRGNPNCGTTPNGKVYAYYTIPGSNTLVYPGLAPGGVVGQEFAVKPGSPSQALAPGKFAPVFMPPGANPAICPDCAKNNNAGGGLPSASLYAMNIECCNTSPVACGSQTVTPITGDMVGPTGSAVDCLVTGSSQNNAAAPNSKLQDTISFSSSYPFFLVTPGTASPYYGQSSIPVSESRSFVTVPIYDGSALCPGMSGSNCGSATVNVEGFAQLFVEWEGSGTCGGQPVNQNSVCVRLINIVLCGAGGGSPGAGSSGSSASSSVSGGVYTIPVRLIHSGN
jgi:Flp pilus assembly protein TadG